MALIMAEKSVTSFLFKRLTFNLLQTFKLSTIQNLNSSPPSTTATTTTTTSESSTKSKRKEKKKNNKKEEKGKGKGKTLFEVAKHLPRYGKGYHMAKSHCINVTYEIIRINVYKDGKRGKAWGLAFKDGLPARFPNRIGGVHDPCWKHIKNPLKLEAPKPDESIPHPLKLEAPKPDESIPHPLKLEAPKPDESIPHPLNLEAPTPTNQYNAMNLKTEKNFGNQRMTSAQE